MPTYKKQSNRLPGDPRISPYYANIIRKDNETMQGLVKLLGYASIESVRGIFKRHNHTRLFVNTVLGYLESRLSKLTGTEVTRKDFTVFMNPDGIKEARGVLDGEGC